MDKKIVEKHISVTDETHKKLRIIAKREGRSMRTIVTKLIDKKFAENVD
jgi:predicted CopG family antitoxin